MNDGHPTQPILLAPRVETAAWGGGRFPAPPDSAAPSARVWLLASLPHHTSAVASGPLAGKTLPELVARWGSDLTGGAPLRDGRLPIMLRLLDVGDATTPLFVSTIPPHETTHDAPTPPARVKTLYVIDAGPGARLLAGWRDRAPDPHDLSSAVDAAALLRETPLRAGDCLLVPIGMPHALRGPALVADLHALEAHDLSLDAGSADGGARFLAACQRDPSATLTRPPRSHIGGAFATVTRLAATERFLLERVRLIEGLVQGFPHAELVLWLILRGTGTLARGSAALPFQAGDLALIPANAAEITVSTAAACDLLEIKIPIASGLAGLPRPERERRDAGPGPVRLTVDGRTPGG